MSGKSQQESEAPAKVYQIDALASKIDDIGNLIKTQNVTYVTKSEQIIEFQKRDARIKNLEDKDKNRTRLVWVLIPIVVGLLINTTWQYIINNGRLQ